MYRLLLSRIGMGACYEIDCIVRTFVQKQSGYTQDYNKPCFQMLFLAKFLAATPMLHWRIFHLFSGTRYMHGHMVVILTLINCHAVTYEIIQLTFK